MMTRPCWEEVCLVDGWRREGKRTAVMVDVLLDYSCAVEEKISLLGKRAPNGYT